MKKIISLSIIGIALCGLAMSMGKPVTDRREEISWDAFCKSRGYAVTDERSEVVNEYLDTWCGSVEEEAVLDSLGIL